MFVRSDAGSTRVTPIRSHRESFSALLQRNPSILLLLFMHSTWVVIDHLARCIAGFLIVIPFKLIMLSLSSQSLSELWVFIYSQHKTLLPAVFLRHSSPNDCVGFCDIRI